MDDLSIIDMYFAHDERAIEQTDIKYGRLCFKIAYNILGNIEDSKECVNDTYLGIWELIPPNRPENFSAYVAKIARYRALKRLEYNTASKRSPQAICSLEELAELVSADVHGDETLENKYIENCINSFLQKQKPERRNIFIWRYWLFMPISEICAKSGYSESKVKSILFNMRKKLRRQLETEGVEV